MQKIKLERTPSAAEKHAANAVQEIQEELHKHEEQLTEIEGRLRPLRAEVASLKEQAGAAALGAEESQKQRDIQRADLQARNLTRSKGQLNKIESTHAEILAKVDDLSSRLAEARAEYLQARHDSDEKLMAQLKEAGEHAVAEVERLSVELARIASAERERATFLFNLMRQNGLASATATSESGSNPWRITRRVMSWRISAAMKHGGLDLNLTIRPRERQWISEQLSGSDQAPSPKPEKVKAGVQL